MLSPNDRGDTPANISLLAIVLNWNSESDTVACVESLLAQRPGPPDILLVDNASTDGSGDRLRIRFPMVSYLQTGENLGYAGGNNRGIAWGLARGAEWLLVLNNDTVAEPDCIARLLEPVVANDRLAATAPLIVRFDDPNCVWFAGGTFSRLRAVGQHNGEGRRVADVVDAAIDARQPRRCTFLSGCCMLIRARALDGAEAFREDFFAYVEDAELCLRLVSAGWELAWIPAARLAHRVPPHLAPASPWQIVQRDRNRRRLVASHYSGIARVKFYAWFWSSRLILLARYALAGDWERLQAIIRGAREA